MSCLRPLVTNLSGKLFMLLRLALGHSLLVSTASQDLKVLCSIWVVLGEQITLSRFNLRWPVCYQQMSTCLLPAPLLQQLVDGPSRAGDSQAYLF